MRNLMKSDDIGMCPMSLAIVWTIGRCLTSDVAPQETGTMVGKGHAMAVVSPGSLRDAIQVLEACLDADVAILPQGRRTM